MKTEDLNYELPEGFIATTPASPRSDAKMLVVDRDEFRHKKMSDFPNEFCGDELIIFNETAVLPARIQGTKRKTRGKIEGLFLEQDDVGNWLMMLKSNGKLRIGTELDIGSGVRLTIISRDDAIWRCACNNQSDPSELLAVIGGTPLPPYIRSARGDEEVDDEVDRLAYQTIYADLSQCHSVAAPTAGLHFDEDLLSVIDSKGIERVAVTLHVGAGTFKTVETEAVEDHPMHSEYWSAESKVLQRIAAAKEEGRSIVAIGTTTVRTLESLPDISDWPSSGKLSGATKLLIAPPYEFRLVNGLLTNFHLPKSTLLALVGAMVGLDRLKLSYSEAIKQNYRFYSYGDAMFILP
ncbi:MAG: tRNA preQ1(34) S-adenosylmethionine ribosyltransferase-isomerase QueA [Phycisphaerales bacterium]|nr:tRNA preQ1(34) S-adenosylmethionine ribosyltransferase-isomerase QueA [Phycisphaerales bacterium]